MAATSAALLAGAKLADIAAALKTFPGVEHRLEFVREHNGVRYYNDSKATNVDATEKAIDAFSGKLWIILGGKDKNSDYSVLREKLRQKAGDDTVNRRGDAEHRGQLEGYPDTVRHHSERRRYTPRLKLTPAMSSCLPLRARALISSGVTSIAGECSRMLVRSL